MRVLVFCGDPGVPIHGPSGGSAHLRSVATALKNLGNDVFLAAITPHDARGRYAAHFDLPSVTVGRRRGPVGLRGFAQRLNARRLAARALNEFGPVDLVWERASLHSDAGLRLARGLGARHFLEVNSPLDLEHRRHGQLPAVVRGSDQVLAVSPWMVNWAHERGARRVVHLPNASSLQPAGVRKLKQTTLVHHGSNRRWHGVEFFPVLLDALPDVQMRVIGSGEVPEHPRLEWLPWLSTAPLGEAIEACHLGILPYPDEAPPWFDPLKVADYRALGLPVLGSTHPCARSADLQIQTGDLKGWVEAVGALVSMRPDPEASSWEAAIGALLD